MSHRTLSLKKLLWLAGVLFLSWAGWRVYTLTQLVLKVQADWEALQVLAARPWPEALAEAGPVIAAARQDVLQLRQSSAVWLWVAPLLAWVPAYGADIAAAPQLLDLATYLLTAADEAGRELLPVMQSMIASEEPMSLPQVVAALAQAKAPLQRAQTALAQAAAVRAMVATGQLSPRLRLMLERTDRLMAVASPLVTLTLAAPQLLGQEQPVAYLVLLQNEDELRAGGGFISAVGVITLTQGTPLAFTVADAYALDDRTLPYPPAPEPLRKYMLTPVWLLRDVNWEPHYPQTAALAERWYTAVRPHTFSGVIALDQTAIRLMVRATGPIQPEGTEVVTAANVEDYMRAQWSSASGETVNAEWWQQRKEFMRSLGAALLTALPTASPPALASALSQALNEKHILVWLKDSSAAAAVAQLGWDGAVRPGEGDYVMLIDSNIGFNKVNAIVQVELHYTVDLTAAPTPTATVTIQYTHPLTDVVPCRHWADYGRGEYTEMIHRCYWDYWRVLLPRQAQLIAVPQNAVPPDQLLSGRGEYSPARVSPGVADTREVAGLFVLPPGKTHTLTLVYHLPAGIVTIPSPGQAEYRLRLQKQPGVNVLPVTVTVLYPQPWQLLSTSLPAAEVAAGSWRYSGRVATDMELQMIFATP